jgi:hypothetical protein
MPAQAGIQFEMRPPHTYPSPPRGEGTNPQAVVLLYLVVIGR